jgi:hypothetical protein
MPSARPWERFPRIRRAPSTTSSTTAAGLVSAHAPAPLDGSPESLQAGFDPRLVPSTLTLAQLLRSPHARSLAASGSPREDRLAGCASTAGSSWRHDPFRQGVSFDIRRNPHLRMPVFLADPAETQADGDVLPSSPWGLKTDKAARPRLCPLEGASSRRPVPPWADLVCALLATPHQPRRTRRP